MTASAEGDGNANGDDAEFGAIILRRLWFDDIVPELKRRGISDDPAEFVKMAQVLHTIGNPRVVRLNQEVKVEVQFRYAGPTVGGAEQVAFVPEVIGELIAVALTEEDPIAGHEIVVRGATGWWVAFDFRYYRKKIMRCVATAAEFGYAARAALEANYLRAFAENAFVAAEQLAWAQLMIIPHKAIIESKSHKHIVNRYNQWTHMGNGYPPFARLLNRLAALRNPARYQGESFSLSEREARDGMALLEAITRSMSVWNPSRAYGPLGLPTREGAADTDRSRPSRGS